jgi:hypothetical protein
LGSWGYHQYDLNPPIACAVLRAVVGDNRIGFPQSLRADAAWILQTVREDIHDMVGAILRQLKI